MKSPRYNISAGYALAEEARSAIRDRRHESYLTDFLEPESDAFWLSICNPQKFTALHIFLNNWEYMLWDQSFGDLPLDEDFDSVSDYLEVCGVSKPRWFVPGGLQSREAAVWKLIESAIPISSNAAFELLYQDREFLLLFQDLIKKGVETSSSSRPLIERASYLPSWLQKAVFHRDRGLCQSCGCDVSGMLNLDNKIHHDHLLPLDAGGTNDATNFQILCADCNLRKGRMRVQVTNLNHRWW